MARDRRYRSADRRIWVIRPRFYAGKASAATKPRYGNMGDRRSVVLSAERSAAMFRQPEERALRYHNYAAFLRRLADRTQTETTRARLRTLADQIDQLAESVHHSRLAA